MDAGNRRRTIVEKKLNDINKKAYLNEFLQKLPDNQYLCTKCGNVP